jgi:DNA-binding ferritin-like protein
MNSSTKRRSTNRKKGTRRTKLINSLASFEKDVTVRFLEMLIMVKLYHWKTSSYATHKATDELYTTLNANIDKFIEVLLGKAGNRINLMGHKNIHLIDLNSPERLRAEINSFKSYLVSITNSHAIKLMSNTDLLNIRDEILGNLNQFLYLLTFK